MSDVVFALCTVLQLSIVPSLSSIHLDEDCLRIRQPLHLLSEDERLLYVEGLHGIRANGRYQIIVEAHSAHGEIHHGSSSFFYHSFYVWEVETQIRKLGAKFECFSMPYYDYTVDAGNERHPMILDSVYGGNGDESNLHCVSGDVWNSVAWPLRETCDATEDSERGCCLKRKLNDEIELSDAVTVAAILETPSFREMSGAVGVEHLKVHQLFGGGNDCAECAMATEFSADDPIFMILHSFTAYLRALWGSCHGYDRIDARELGEHPNVYEATCVPGYEGQCGVIELDDVYEFEAMADANWSLTSREDITPRSMWNFSDWGVAYDHGSFVLMSDIENSRICDRKNIEQSKWFTRSRRKIEEVQGIMDAMESCKSDTNETALDDATLRGDGADKSSSPVFHIAVLGMALLVVAALVGFKLFRISSNENDYTLLESTMARDVYGTIKQ